MLFVLLTAGFGIARIAGIAMIAKIFYGKRCSNVGNYAILAILAILPALIQPDQIHPGIGMSLTHQRLGTIFIVLGHPDAQPRFSRRT